MRLRKALLWSTIILLAGTGLYAALRQLNPSYTYITPGEKVLNPAREASGIRQLQTDPYGIQVDNDMIAFGRQAFYEQTFGNEVFFSDILGITDGAFTIPNIAKAVAKLRGQGTTNLQVEAAKTVKLGDRVIHKGELIDTGLDVAKGAYMPLGIRLSNSEGKTKVGVGCIMCHAISDLETGKVIEGVTNPDINVGLLLALGTNSAAFFTHTGITDEQIGKLAEGLDDYKHTYINSQGQRKQLPDPQKLEAMVDAELVKWPPGYVDTMIDRKSNPVQIPDSFTLGDHPYSWSGLAAGGPFKGLAILSGIPNGQNMDPLNQSEISEPVFGIDKEQYVGMILQNAANPKYRYSTDQGSKPSKFFEKIDPTPGATGVNHLVPTPAFPRSSLVSLVGNIASVPGHTVSRHTLAMAAYQNALVPPPSRLGKLDRQLARKGQDVFKRAGCISCHAGEFLTNNRIIASHIIGTNPSRAKALSGSKKFFAPPLMYTFDTPVPLPEHPKTFKIGIDYLSEDEVKMSVAHDGKGGYKVPSLNGLYWSAPYLHDGGVAVGPKGGTQLGIPGTLYQGIVPDPVNSLRAMIDRDLRKQVVEANHNHKDLRKLNIEGVGHDHYVDSKNGFTKEEQDALIHYLLTLHDKE
ncbi:electron transport protein [Paenibacillus sambharensis]|uniref:Electron transport protein n=1 Tax=Paenibacillus sambharensis TaxID=1803190 RepID=A0A2W1LU49_9BACL|nr:electron transport protein [Paenibacillus sambharensis]PZD94997.1 electron transport protein [Paenibacillus sambharensis]